MMQPQGLQALIPPELQAQQQMPPGNNPRLAAATSLVSSDAEEQILDPRTLAMLKYKDAMQAMQAADQLMAQQQPTPTPPTVAERTKLAAEQGIASMASRLAPGIQQQGNRLMAQQAQQVMQGGGLPQLPAPNMSRMAAGGIVAFQDGGVIDRAINTAKSAIGGVFGNPPSYEEAALLSKLISSKLDRLQNQGVLSQEEYLAAQNVISGASDSRASKTNALLDMNDYLDQLANTSSKSNMAAGGIVGFQDGGRPEDKIEQAGRDLADQFRREIEEDRRRREAAVIRNREAALMASGVPMPPRPPMLDRQVLAAEAPIVDTATPAAISTPDFPSMDEGIASVLRSRTGDTGLSFAPMPTGQRPLAVQEQNDVARLLEEAQALASGSNVGTSTAAPSSRLETRVSEALERNLDPEAAARARAEEQRFALEALRVPEELKELYRARLAALDAPLYTPEEARDRRLNALLSGLASSNRLAQSGPAASAGIMSVADEMRSDARSRAERQFELASGLMGMDREAAAKAYEAGRAASTTATNQAGVALQSAVSQLNSINQTEAAASLQQLQMQFDTVRMGLDAALKAQEIGQLSTRQANDTAQVIAGVLKDSAATKATLFQTLVAIPEDQREDLQEAIDAIELQEAAYRDKLNQLVGVSNSNASSQNVIPYTDL